MAKTKRKSRSRKTREVSPQHELPGGFWRQVIAFLMIVISVILVFTWFGSGGSLLNQIHHVSLLFVGYATYFIPLLLVYLAVKIFRTPDNRLPVVVWLATGLMILWLSGIFGLPTIKQPNPTGGQIGESLNNLVIQILAPSVAAFIYLCLIFITAIFILQVSPVAVFRNFLALFRTTRKAEDVANAKVARAAAETSHKAQDLPIKINSSFTPADAPAPTPADSAKKSSSPEPEKTLVSISDPNWKQPPIELLTKKQSPPDGGDVQQNAEIIRTTFADFGIEVKMEGANVGPRVTQYTMSPPPGVNLNKILARDRELALNLAVDNVRIEAPIPGTRNVGVELPNKRDGGVYLRNILESPEWKNATAPLTFAVGKDISGHAVVADLAAMPHLLIAGTTGSGKSIMSSVLISSLLYRNSPSDMKLIIIDPKQVDLTLFDNIPHLLTPVISEPEKALSAITWAVNEMERRYASLREAGVRNISDYNAKMANQPTVVKDQDGNQQAHDGGKMPYIVIMVDEMNDLMMAAGKELERPIVRVAQKGRAAGIHLILATQRPEVKVITGLIKSNVPGRIAFRVESQMDSRIILNAGGAEKLLGAGDMLLFTTGKPRRIQGAYMDDKKEVTGLVNFLREQRPPEYNPEIISQAVTISGAPAANNPIGEFGRTFDPNDPVVRRAVEITLQQGKFATATLQTYLGKGHGFVSGLAIWLESIGVIGPTNGNKPRDVLIQSLDDFDKLAGL